MSSIEAAEVDPCLAFEVRRPGDWIGVASATCLQGFLAGAEFRATCVQPSLPNWRIYGVLEDSEFYEPLVAATGSPSLTIKWARAIEMTHFSLAEGFAALRDAALAGHNERAVEGVRAVYEWKVGPGSVAHRAVIALDFRTSATDPRVVAPDWSDDEMGLWWREVSSTFTVFCSRIGLLPP